jgi:hypothetical protein
MKKTECNLPLPLFGKINTFPNNRQKNMCQMVSLVILTRHNVTSLVLPSNGDKFAKDKGENKVNTYIMAAAYTTA